MMRETGIGTSLLLIAIGAVLAFAVNLQTTGIDLNAVGVILMIVGLLGLALSMVALEGMFAVGPRNLPDYHDEHVHEPEMTPPHEHRQPDTHDVVYEDANGTTVERVRRSRKVSPH
jgi:hypothetical protein